MIDVMNVIVFHTLTGDILPYRIVDKEIVINSSTVVREEDCIVSVWEHVRDLNIKYGLTGKDSIDDKE